MSVVPSKVYSVAIRETNIHSNVSGSMSVVASKMGLRFEQIEHIFGTDLRIRSLRLPAEAGGSGCDTNQEARMSTIALTPSGPSLSQAGPRTDRPRLRLTRRGRAVLLVLAALPLVLWLLFAQLNGGAATGSLEGGAVPIVVVEPGESLWALAERIAPGSDPRDVIDAIVAFNHLGSADVMAGQQLGIPAPYGANTLDG